MAGDTNIEWARKVLNAVVGCTVLSPGCTNCYAMKMAWRVQAMAAGRGHTSSYDGLTQQTKAGAVWNGEVRLVEKALLEPYRWRRPERVFVDSMGDLFHPSVPDHWIDLHYALFALTPRHTYMPLTKRPERRLAYLTDPNRLLRMAELVVDHPTGRRRLVDLIDLVVFTEPLPNVWEGISVEDQDRLAERAEDFARTPAALHWISAEPLLGEIDLCNIALPGRRHLDLLAGMITRDGVGLDFLSPVRLVVVGGESGPKARDCWVPNVRSVVRQCADTGTKVFVKQLGARVIDRNDAGFDGSEDHHWPEMDPDDVEDDLSGYRDGYQGAPVRVHLASRKGSDMAEWPKDLRVRQLPEELGA